MLRYSASLLGLCLGLAAQPMPPQFDAASVKAVVFAGKPIFDGDLRGGPSTNDPGRITYTTVKLRRVIAIAYGVDPARIAGPASLDEDRFDITATMPAGTNGARFRAMLQDLLDRRFSLAVHHESRNSPVYLLSVARGGAKLHPAASSGASTGCQVVRPGAEGSRHETGIRDAVNHWACSNITMDAFALALRDMALLYLDRPVVDRTGLAGAYDFTLDWSTHQDPTADDQSPTRGVGGFTLFEALDRQLGLALDARDAPLDTIVVDRISRTPSGN